MGRETRLFVLPPAKKIISSYFSFYWVSPNIFCLESVITIHWIWAPLKLLKSGAWILFHRRLSDRRIMTKLCFCHFQLSFSCCEALTLKGALYDQTCSTLSACMYIVSRQINIFSKFIWQCINDELISVSRSACQGSGIFWTHARDKTSAHRLFRMHNLSPARVNFN